MSDQSQGTREWDAASYDSLPLPHEQWGRRVLDRLCAVGLTGTERLLDAGSGTGRDAAAARERWPGLRLVLLDGSVNMLEQARARLGDQADYVHADLRLPLPIHGEVQAAMSVAAFHWVPDHQALFDHLFAVLEPGAPLVSDCGGRGNVAQVNRALAQVTGVPTDEWEFAGVEETRVRLERSGFEVLDVRLRPDPFRCPDPAVLEEFLGTVVLGSQLAELAEADRAGFVREVRLALADPVVDYVRLEIEARRRG